MRMCALAQYTHLPRPQLVDAQPCLQQEARDVPQRRRQRPRARAGGRQLAAAEAAACAGRRRGGRAGRVARGCRGRRGGAGAGAVRRGRWGAQAGGAVMRLTRRGRWRQQAAAMQLGTARWRRSSGVRDWYAAEPATYGPLKQAPCARSCMDGLGERVGHTLSMDTDRALLDRTRLLRHTAAPPALLGVAAKLTHGRFAPGVMFRRSSPPG